jgi:hypothetical protein
MGAGVASAAGVFSQDDAAQSTIADVAPSGPEVAEPANTTTTSSQPPQAIDNAAIGSTTVNAPTDSSSSPVLLSPSAPAPDNSVTSTSVATSNGPQSAGETVTEGSATVHTEASVLPGAAESTTYKYEKNCNPDGTCSSSTAIAVTSNGQSLSYSSGSASTAGNGAAGASSSATAGGPPCAAVPPTLKATYNPDGTKSISYEYSAGGNCATTSVETR